MPARQVIFSRTAREELDAISDYVDEVAGPEVADALVAAIVAGTEKLADMPQVGHRHRDVRDPRFLVWIVKRKYVIVYRATRERLYVARIVHGARDFRRLFKGPKY